MAYESTKTTAVKNPSQTRCFRIALAHRVKACLLALALVAGATGCKATQTPPRVEPSGAQTRPLTPQEWRQLNFPEESPKPAGQAPTLTAKRQRAPQTTNSNLPAEPVKASPGAANPASQTTNSPPQTNAPTPAFTPVPQPSPSAQAANSTPKPLVQAGQPVSLPTNPIPAQVRPANPAVSQAASPGAQTNQPAQLLLREGDSVRISFPGAPTLNTLQQIRRDGMITLPLVGEFKAAGLAPSRRKRNSSSSTTPTSRSRKSMWPSSQLFLPFMSRARCCGPAKSCPIGPFPRWKPWSKPASTSPNRI